LELLDGDRLDIHHSKYANYILSLLQQKGSGQVLNRGEIIQDVLGVEYMAPNQYRLEPEWVAVLAAGLVYNGDVVLAVPGKKFDANNLDSLVSTPIEELINFKHVEQPKDWNLPALRALFDLLGLTPGMAQLVTQGKDEPVQELQKAVTTTVNNLVIARQNLQSLIFWGKNLLTDVLQDEYRSSLDKAKTFLESLQAFTTPGKLKNLRYQEQEVTTNRSGLQTLEEITALQDLVTNLNAIASYLTTAEAVSPVDSPWLIEMRQVQQEILTDILNQKKRTATNFRQQTSQKLTQLKQSYIHGYMGLHTSARLGVIESDRKTQLTQDTKAQSLQKLASIDLMPASQLRDWQNSLASLKTCTKLTEQDLQANPICPHCQFKPTSGEVIKGSASSLLGEMEKQLEQLLTDWTHTLFTNLEDPTTQANLNLLKVEQRQLVDDFLTSRILPSPLTNEFIGAVREVLSGLAKVVVKTQDLQKVLLAGGSPCTVQDMKKRFEDIQP
jgi:hypothetical protein